MHPLNPDLRGRTALVTGGASGIGAACARRLAAGGAEVIVADVDEAGAGETAEAIGGRPYPVDLADLDAADRLATAAREAGVDLVVNNAGVQHVAPIEEFPTERFSHILRLMVEAPFRLVRGILPGMYERGFGRVVNISSVHGLRASPYKAAYVSAKHGLEGLSKTIALEGASRGVTSVCVSPGYVRTPLVERQITDQAAAHGLAESDVLSEVILASAALKRLVEPDEVAEMVAYLCGPHAASMTGVSVTMDGGWTAH